MNYMFDFFDTLVEANDSVYYKLLGEFFGDFDIELRKKLSTTNYESEIQAIQDLCDIKGIKKTDEEMQLLIQNIGKWKGTVKLFPDTVNVLQELKDKGSKLGIVSNNNILVEDVIETLNLTKHFDFILLSHKEQLRKPSTEIFKKMLALMNCDAKDATMIGDQYDKDVEAPKKIGINAILMDPYHNSDKENKIHKLSELL